MPASHDALLIVIALKHIDENAAAAVLSGRDTLLTAPAGLWLR